MWRRAKQPLYTEWVACGAENASELLGNVFFSGMRGFTRIHSRGFSLSWIVTGFNSAGDVTAALFSDKKCVENEKETA